MTRFRNQGRKCAAVPTAGLASGESRSWLVRTAVTAGAMLSLAVVGGLSFAAAEADATTFPGTNGRIAASGALAPLPAPPEDELASQLEIFTMNPGFVASDTTPVDPTECRLTFNTLHSDFNPRYSKNGKRIVWVQDNNLWTMQLDADGKCPDPNSQDGNAGNPKLLTASANDSYVGGWCTDANNDDWVVFQRNTVALSFDVYKQKVKPNRDPDGAPIPLTAGTGSESQPAVTPDCSKVAFHSNRAGTGTANSDVWVMGFNGEIAVNGGSPPVNRTDCLQTTESAPGWSPGTATSQGGTGSQYRIVFQTNQHGTTAPQNIEIYRMDDVDVAENSGAGDGCGDNQTRLTNSASNAESGETGLDLTGYDLSAQYSPDGSKICFHSGRAMDRISDGDPGTPDPPDPAFRNSGGAGVLGQWEIYTQSSSALNGSVERKTKRKGNDERCGWGRTPDPS